MNDNNGSLRSFVVTTNNTSGYVVQGYWHTMNGTSDSSANEPIWVNYINNLELGKTDRCQYCGRKHPAIAELCESCGAPL